MSALFRTPRCRAPPPAAPAGMLRSAASVHPPRSPLGSPRPSAPPGDHVHASRHARNRRALVAVLVSYSTCAVLMVTTAPLLGHCQSGRRTRLAPQVPEHQRQRRRQRRLRHDRRALSSHSRAAWINLAPPSESPRSKVSYFTEYYLRIAAEPDDSKPKLRKAIRCHGVRCHGAD